VPNTSAGGLPPARTEAVHSIGGIVLTVMVRTVSRYLFAGSASSFSFSIARRSERLDTKLFANIMQAVPTPRAESGCSPWSSPDSESPIDDGVIWKRKEGDPKSIVAPVPESPHLLLEQREVPQPREIFCGFLLQAISSWIGTLETLVLDVSSSPARIRWSGRQ